MSEQPTKKRWPLSFKSAVMALVTGGMALAVILADLIIPILGTDIATDPREMFTTIGAALSGPAGGVLIGILAGIAVPNYPAASMIAHIVGGIWMGWAFKEFVYKRLRMPLFLLGWAGIVMAYYYLFLMPTFILGLMLLYDGATSFFTVYADIAQGALTEAFVTTAVTTIAMFAIPGKYRRPLW